MKMNLTALIAAFFMSIAATGGWAATDNGDGTVTAEGLIWLKDVTWGQVPGTPYLSLMN